MSLLYLFTEMFTFLTVYRLGIKYTEHIMALHGKVDASPVTCSLDAGERITQVNIYKGFSKKGFAGLTGIHFITNMKHCPLFGNTSSDSALASGHQLLVIAAKRNVVIKTLEMYYDYGCQQDN